MRSAKQPDDNYQLAQGNSEDHAESVLHEGGMTKADFDQVLKSALNEEDTDIVGLDVFQDPATRHMFKTLAKRYNISTAGCEVISAALSLDSKYALIVVRQHEDMFDSCELRAFDVEKMQKTPAWAVRYAGKYLKVKHLDQNNEATMYAVPYNDHGKYYVSIIDPKKGQEVKQVKVNQILSVDARSLPIDDIDDPLITCCFTDSMMLFVSCYHRLQRRQYHFTYNIETGKATRPQQIDVPESTAINFPQRVFYNAEWDECYTFYRQGQVVTVQKPGDADPFGFCEKMTHADLGDMYLAFEKALIVRSSNSILVFKKEQVEVDVADGEGTELVWQWRQIHKINNMRGQISFIRGNTRFQITTEEKIFFFIFRDKVGLIPELENVMANFMECSQMIIGSKVRYCITFKAGQSDFSVFTRRQYHNFKVPLDVDNFEAALGANLGKFNQYVITQRRVVNIFNMRDFKEVQEFDVLEQGRIDDDETHILYMTVSECQERIGLLLGKDMTRGRIRPTHLQVYENSSTKAKKWKKLCSTNFDFDDACRQFVFSNVDNRVLYFFTAEHVFEYNYMTATRMLLYQYSSRLDDPPTLGTFDDEQQRFIVASDLDVVYVNMKDGQHVDLAREEELSAIKQIYYFENNFYILANKKSGQLGFYLQLFHADRPKDHTDLLVGWHHMLDIADADMQLLRSSETELESDFDEVQEMEFEKKVKKQYKSLVVSFKMVGINTFNVFVVDLETHLIKYWHESYQLWESNVKGFLLKSKEFMILSKDGINLIMLGDKAPRAVVDKNGERRMLHSLEEMNYLKIEPTNHIYFSCQYYDDRQVCIQDQYLDTNNDTKFDDIYKIKLWEPTLREILLIQSIYGCTKLSDIDLIVKEQPTPTIFFKVFLELDMKCMTIHLAFDNRSIKDLLDKKNKQYFHEDNPIFYMNRDKRTAIDVALERNQIKSVDLMLRYIRKYQNSYVYAYLFKYNLVELLNRGVRLAKLMDSQIISHIFDFPEWPGTSHHTEKEFGAFNDSVFRLRKKFKHVYPQFVSQRERVDEQGRAIKVYGGSLKRATSSVAHAGSDLKDKLLHRHQEYKIEYQINQLCNMSTEDGDIVTAIADSEEVALFQTDTVMDMIDFKWARYAARVHVLGMIIHVIYLIYLLIYVKLTFIDEDAIDPSHMVPMHAVKDDDHDLQHKLDQFKMTEPDHDNRIYPDAPQGLVVQGILLIYPMVYSARQWWRSGMVYWITPYYWIEILNILFGWASIYCQLYWGTWDIGAKIVLIILIFISCLKTLFYLKILKSFSYIVTMVISVVFDLRYFVFFYVIMISFFSMLFDIVGRNYSKEYLKLPWLVGNWLAVFRLALGDFDFTLLEGANLTKTHILFWVLWLIMVLFSSLIFLNFIIAQVSDSYATVKENIDSYIYKERAKLVSEAEGLLSQGFKARSKDWFPDYIIIRQLEDRLDKDEKGKKKKKGNKK